MFTLTPISAAKKNISRAILLLGCSSALLLVGSGCFMTKSQGDKLTNQVRLIEDEIAKLQRVRHDMEILLVGQVRDLVDRIARLENHVKNFRESLSDGSSRNNELLAELQNLREELEQSQHRFRNLEQDQLSLAKNQVALKEAQNKIRIPPLKEDHFALAKKYYAGNKFDEATLLFDAFVKEYPEEKEVGECYFTLGEINRKLAESNKSETDADILHKRAVVSYQKIIELHKDSPLREEALYKMGSILKTMGNKEGAQAAFKELLATHQNGKRVKDAKKQLADMGKKSK